jgi:hypothetical protein
MADEVSTTVRSIVEKVLEADVTDQIARRGRELATAVGEATDTVSTRASAAWQESEPTRRDAQKAIGRARQDALHWTRRTWDRDLRPALRDLWSRRTLAIGAAGAAIPAGREMVEDAADRLGIRKRRESRHWAAFFMGLVLGAVAGAVLAMLTTPKAGREMRDELTERAREAAERARASAGGASDWVPLFQRNEANGQATRSEAVEAEAPSELAPEGGEGDVAT